MSATATLSARQRGAGQSVTVIARESITDQANYDANNDWGVGVKVGATPPTNVSEFADTFKYYESPQNGSFAISMIKRNGINVAVSQRSQLNTVLPIAGTVLAGRYLFAYCEGVAGALQDVSPGYLIT